MIKIRLTRHGATNNAFYRLIAIDSTKRREGEPLEVLGYWHPSTKTQKIDKKKVEAWVKKGAQITVGAQKVLQ